MPSTPTSHDRPTSSAQPTWSTNCRPPDWRSKSPTGSPTSTEGAAASDEREDPRLHGAVGRRRARRAWRAHRAAAAGRWRRSRARLAHHQDEDDADDRRRRRSSRRRRRAPGRSARRAGRGRVDHRARSRPRSSPARRTRSTTSRRHVAEVAAGLDHGLLVDLVEAVLVVRAARGSRAWPRRRRRGAAGSAAKTHQASAIPDEGERRALTMIVAIHLARRGTSSVRRRRGERRARASR